MSQGQGKGSFLRHAVVYGLGGMLAYSAGFLLLPLYTHYLSPAEFGTLDVLCRMGEVAGICLLFGGIRQALLAFHGQAEDDAERRRTVVTILWLLLVLGGVGVAVFGVLGESFARHLSISDARLLPLAITAAVLESAAVVLLAAAQARTESTFYVGMVLVQLVTRVAVSLVFVAGLEWGVQGVLAGSAMSSLLTVLLIGGRELARGPLRPDFVRAAPILWFALPFLPSGLGAFVLNSGDRFFLLHWGGDEAVGTYALGYKLAVIAGTLSKGPLCMVWSARMYEAAKRPDAAHVFGRVFTRIIGVYLWAGTALCVFQDEAVRLLGGHRYAAATQIIAPVVLAYFFLTCADLMDAAFFVRRRTGPKTWITATSTLLTLLFYALLIPPYAAAGAAAATLLGFAFHAALTWRVSQRVFRMNYELGRVATMLATAAGTWAISRCLPAELWALPFRAALLILGPALLWATGGITREEKEWLARTVQPHLRLVRTTLRHFVGEVR